MAFGNLGNMAEMFKQAQKMQGELKKIKDNLKNLKYEAESNGVKVLVDGELEIKDLLLNMQLDPKKLEESIKQAVNRALKQAKDDAAKQLKSVTGGLSIPGLT